MDNVTLIDSLLSIRANLTSALREAGYMGDKLIGPRDVAGQAMGNPPASMSVRGVVGEIDVLTVCLQKTLAEHHATMGNFDKPTNPQRAYA